MLTGIVKMMTIITLDAIKLENELGWFADENFDRDCEDYREVFK